MKAAPLPSIPTFSTLSRKGSVGTVLLLLLLLAGIELATDAQFYAIVTGKVALTQPNGTTLVNSLSTTGKLVVAWTGAAFIDLILAAYIPVLALGSTTAILLLVVLSHEQTVGAWLQGISTLISTPSSTSPTSSPTSSPTPNGSVPTPVARTSKAGQYAQ